MSGTRGAGSLTLTTLAGTELVQVDNGGAVNTQTATATLAALVGATKQSVVNTSTLATAGTLTAANVTGASDFVALRLTGNPAGAAALTLPTVAAVVAALPNPLAAQSYVLRIVNGANSDTWTVTTATGWTLTGTMTIATGTWRDFNLSLTSTSAAVLTNAGGGNVI